MTTETNETPRNGSITAGLTTGIIGTALGALNTLGGGAALLGGFGGNGFAGRAGYSPPPPPPQSFVTKEEFDLNSKLMAKDAEIADLKSQNYTDAKLVDVYKDLQRQIKEVDSKVDTNRDRGDGMLFHNVEKINARIDCNKSFQDGVNAQQLAYNATNSANLACLQNQVAQLQGMTKLVVPNSSVCPGWGSVTITPATLSA